MNKLLMPKIPQTNDVVFERAALNVLALSCVFRDNDFDYDKYVIKVEPSGSRVFLSSHRLKGF